MSRHHDTWVNVHHWLNEKDFNSSDCFRPRLRSITLWLFLCINMAVGLPSKNLGGNDVTSHIFPSMILFQVLDIIPSVALCQDVQLLLATLTLLWLWTDFVSFCMCLSVCVCVCVCVCACVFLWAIFLVCKCVNFFACSNKFSQYKLYPTPFVYPQFRHV
jgi:hypothetical protein